MEKLALWMHLSVGGCNIHVGWSFKVENSVSASAPLLLDMAVQLQLSTVYCGGSKGLECLCLRVISWKIPIGICSNQFRSASALVPLVSSTTAVLEVSFLLDL